MLTVGKLKELIKDMPDDAVILQDDPYSEFTYNILEAKRGFTKIIHTTNDGKILYESWTEGDFNDFLEDNIDEEEEIREAYKPSLLLYLEL